METPPEQTQREHALAGAWLPQAVPLMHPLVLFPSVVFLLALIDLFGWTFHVPILTSGLPHFATMKPNTALALGLLAVCSRARMRKPINPQGRLGGTPCLALGIAMVLSCGTLFEYLSGTSLGLDGLILGVPLDHFGDPAGRMAFGTAVCLTLTGLALGFLDKAPRASIWMLLTANMITVAALLGFIVNRGPLFNVIWLRSLAVPTTLSLVMLGVATLASRPERRPVSFLFPSGASAGRGYWPVINGIVFAMLGALPSVVAMRVGIPEALITLFGLALSLYSAQTWSQSMHSARHK